MSNSAWTYQRPEQVRELGEDVASWYCGWYDPEGKRRSKSFGCGDRGKNAADRFRRKVEAELMTGTYRAQLRKPWAEFRQEYEARIVPGMAPGSRVNQRAVLNHFERIVKPVRLSAVGSQAIADYVAQRRKEPGKKPGDLVSPTTINKELHLLRAIFNIAVQWECMSQAPKIRLERELKRRPRYVTGDHFAAIYLACDTAVRPEVPNVTPGDWWRGFLAMAYMTGWRVGDLLALRRDCVDLETGRAMSLAEDNKARRDDVVTLPPDVVSHLRPLWAHFDPLVFPWHDAFRQLYNQFHAIQAAAGVTLPCRHEHKHSDCCYRYGFHDLRRAFATMNADKLTPDALQALMRHRSYATTQKYINLARQVDAAAAAVHVPDVIARRRATGTT